MFRGILATMLVFACCNAPALADSTTPAKPPSSAQLTQQERMKTCNADASARKFKGQARQDYMSACLSGKASQTNLMKVCNEQATQDKLSTDARKSYVSACLKKTS
jgi:hypothetical protein